MPLAEIEAIPLVVGRVADDEWIKRLHDQSNGSMFLREGQDITMENQIVVQAGEFLERWGIKRTHFVFDGSMRAGISTEMIKVLGNAVNGLDYGVQATERQSELTGKKLAKDLYTNFVTEMYFNFARLVQSGQFRGAELIPAAIAQICRRSWKPTKGDLKALETKPDYKKANQGKSPDDSDVLVMALEAALRAGFMENPRGRPSTIGGINRVREMMANHPMFKRKTSKPLRNR